MTKSRQSHFRNLKSCSLKCNRDLSVQLHKAGSSQTAIDKELKDRKHFLKTEKQFLSEWGSVQYLTSWSPNDHENSEESVEAVCSPSQK